MIATLILVSYLNKLVDQYNNIYTHSIGKKPINADHPVWTKKFETNSKASKFKGMIESELLSIRILLVKFILKIGKEKCLLLILF